jgi:hypothetical protein
MELSLSQMLAGYFMYYINPMYAMLLLLRFFRIYYYTVHGDKELIQMMVKKLAPDIHTLQVKHLYGKNLKDGYFWSRKSIGFINTQEDALFILTTPSYYHKLITTDDKTQDVKAYVPPPEVNKIIVHLRRGSYSNFYYPRMSMDISHIAPLPSQLDIMHGIVALYNKQQRATIFIHGITGAGKSTIGILLAKHLSGIYCHSFNPSDPGDSLSSLMVDISKDSDEPLIVVIEEVDSILRAVHTNSVTKHAKIPTLVHNKSSWSNFLDDMLFYKGLILILTSNTSKEDIDAWDTSYLREGRIHAHYSMMTPINLHALQEESATGQTE